MGESQVALETIHIRFRQVQDPTGSIIGKSGLLKLRETAQAYMLVFIGYGSPISG